MKIKEKYIEDYINYLYGDVINDEVYAIDIQQSKTDFRAGLNAGQPKWNFPVNELPEEDTEVLCALVNGWAEELTKHAVLRYFDGNWYGDISENEVVEKWTVIPR